VIPAGLRDEIGQDAPYSIMAPQEETAGSIAFRGTLGLVRGLYPFETIIRPKLRRLP